MRHVNPNSRFNKLVFYIMFVMILTGLLLLNAANVINLPLVFAVPLALLAAVSFGEMAAS